MLTEDDLYKSAKVPFAFDYADADADVVPSADAVEKYGNAHGTHVAGIAAGKTVAAADCLVPGIGESIGGSQREERLELLESRIRELGMNPEDYWWYCDLRRYGSCKHAGFGLGFERMVMYLTGVSNIRDVELHPRTVGNAEF